MQWGVAAVLALLHASCVADNELHQREYSARCDARALALYSACAAQKERAFADRPGQWDESAACRHMRDIMSCMPPECCQDPQVAADLLACDRRTSKRAKLLKQRVGSRSCED